MARPEITGQRIGEVTTADLVTTASALPADLLEQMRADAGLGISFKPEDQQIPLVRVLQNGSPVCIPRGADYIAGAEAGHFWLRGARDPIRDGKEGIVVIHCGMARVFMEWLPNRQGLVGRHVEPPDDLQTQLIKTESGRQQRALTRSSSGNVIQDTREIYLLIDGAPYVLPCASTFHSFAKEWNGYCKQFLHPQSGATMPSFSRRYKLRTVPVANALGHWFGLKFDDLGWLTDSAQYQAARALASIVDRGLQRVEVPVNEGAAVEPARVVGLASGPKSAPGAA